MPGVGTRIWPKVVSRRVFEAFDVTETVYPPGLRQAPHAHRRTHITLVVSGSMLETVDVAEEVAGALDVVVKPGGTRHANVVGVRGARTFQIRFQDAYVDALPDDGPLRDWHWLRHGAAAMQLFAIMQEIRMQGVGGCARIRDDVDDLVATLVPGGPTRSGSPPRWLERIKQEVDEHFPDRVRVGSLAAREGVHPVYLARAFRCYYGCPITVYLRRLRLRRAAVLLERSQEPLAVVALEAGFCDQAHFCREFKSCTGLTPLGFRRVVAASPSTTQAKRGGGCIRSIQGLQDE